MPQLLFKVTGRFFFKSSGEPVKGKEYKVWLYDKDIVTDDKLGEGTLDDEGRVEIACDLSDASSIDSPGEKKPDLYFILLKKGHEIYRSKVFKDSEPFVKDPFTGKKKGVTLYLGTFEI